MNLEASSSPPSQEGEGLLPVHVTDRTYQERRRESLLRLAEQSPVLRQDIWAHVDLVSTNVAAERSRHGRRRIDGQAPRIAVVRASAGEGDHNDASQGALLASKSADGKPDSLTIQAEAAAYSYVHLSHCYIGQLADTFCEACGIDGHDLFTLHDAVFRQTALRRGD